MNREILLYAQNRILLSWLMLLISFPLSISSFLLIVTDASSEEPTFDTIGLVVIGLSCLSMSINAVASVYGIRRSKYKVVWVEEEKKLKKIGRNSHQEVSAQEGPIQLRINYNVPAIRGIKILILEAADKQVTMSIAGSHTPKKIEKIMLKILESCGEHCVRETKT